MINEARREQLREYGRRGGKARAALPDFKHHQSAAGRRSAEVNDMSALGRLGAKEVIRKYGYPYLFQLMRAQQLCKPSSHTRQVMAILDELGYTYEREAQVLGPEVLISVDFYLADANDAVIEMNGKPHYDPFFDHPNYPGTRRGNDLNRIRRLERAGYRVLEIDYRELSNPQRVAGKIVAFLLN